MLQFNGKPLPRGVGLLNYTVSSPMTTRRTIDIPEARGVTRTGSKLGARYVSLSYVLWGESVRQNGLILNELSKWCYSEGAGQLILPGMETGYLEAECSTYPQPQIGMGQESEIQFFCYRPEFISVAEYSGSATGTNVIAGSVPTPMLFELTVASDLTDPEFEIAGKTIAVDGTVEAGPLVIDTEFGIVRSNGENIASLLTLDSEPYIMAAPGALAVTLPAGVTGTVKWRNRWI